MPAENEEIDVLKNRRWRPFLNLLRGAPCLYDELILREFERAFVPSLRRACRLLKVKELVTACIHNNAAEVERLQEEHRKQRDRAEGFADLIALVCEPGMSFKEGVDAFVHAACARIIDQAALAVIPSDNYPTIEAYRQASAIWLLRLEENIAKWVTQVIENPAKLRVERKTRNTQQVGEDQQLRLSLLDLNRANQD